MKKIIFSFLFVWCALSINAQAKKETMFVSDPVSSAQFPGGAGAMHDFINQNLRYPNTESDVTGRIFIRFLVSETGAIDSVRVARGIDPAFDAEAMSVVQMMPRWTPAKQNGQAVGCYYTIPIVFRLNY